MVTRLRMADLSVDRELNGNLIYAQDAFSQLELRISFLCY